MEKLLIESGFTPNKWGDAFDNGNYRVYFDDNQAHVVKFNNPKAQLIQWDSVIDMNMGEDKAMIIINTMTAITG